MWDRFVAKLQPLLQIMQEKYLENRLLDYAWSALLLLLALLLIWIVRVLVFRRMYKNAERSASSLGMFFATTCQKTLQPLLYFGAFYLSVYNLNKHPSLAKTIYVAGIILVTLLSIGFLLRLADHSLRRRQEDETARQPWSHGLASLLKIVIWTFGIIFLLDNLGFKISTVIAGLGIGGVAVALAAQTILGDLFNYFVILFDRPFDIGDFIVAGDISGTVESIGIKTTRLRSLGGEELVLANSDLARSRLHNYKRMQKRRVNFQLNVTYQTKYEQLKAIPGIIAGIVKNIQGAQYDSAYFTSYGTSALVFEIVYYVLSSDYTRYLEIQQEINLAIKQQFHQQGIEFAYPTQMLYVK